MDCRLIKGSWLLAGLLAVTLIGLAGCGGGGGTVDATGQILGRATIADRGDGNHGGIAVIAEPLSGSGTYTAVTAADGAFNIRHVPPGAYRVSAVKDGNLGAVQNRVEVRAREATEINLVLTPTGSIAGTVTLQSSSTNALAVVSVLGASYNAMTAADGSYRISNVPVGTHQVVALRDGFVPGTPQEVTVTAGAEATANFTLLPTALGDSQGMLQVLVLYAALQAELALEWFDPTLLPSPTDVLTATEFFERKLQQDPNDPAANVGAALGGLIRVSMSLGAKYGVAINLGGNGEIPVPGFSRSRSLELQLPNLVNLREYLRQGRYAQRGFTTAVSFAPSTVGVGSSPTRGRDTVGDHFAYTIEEVQTDLAQILVPAMELAVARLRVAEQATGPILRYWLTGETWYAVTADEVRLLESVLDVELGLLYQLLIYDLDPGDYDFALSPPERDTDEDGLLQPTEYLPALPFGTYPVAASRAGNGAYAPLAKAAYLRACMVGALAITNLLTSQDEHSLLNVQDDPDLRDDLEQVRDTLVGLAAAFQGPVTTELILKDDEGNPLPLTVDLGVFFDNLPPDLRSWAPDLIYEGSEEEGYMVWPDPTSWPDPTFGGLFPNPEQFPPGFFGGGVR